MRGTWRLGSGREITRTVKREVVGDPHDAERRAVVFHEFMEELQASGHDFPEGRGALVAVLGTLTD